MLIKRLVLFSLILTAAHLWVFPPTGEGGVVQGNFSIHGRVSLPDGRPAARIMVRVEGLNGFNREVQSDDQGIYEFRSVPGGRFRLTARSPHDSTLFVDPVEADTGRTAGNRVLVHIFLRRAPEKKENHKPGVVSIAEAAQNVPGKARRAFEQGLRYKEEKRFERAIASFDDAIKIYPEYFQALTERGDVRLGTGKCAAATADFELALKLNEKYVPALRGAGYCSLEQQHYTEAARYLVRALETDADDAKSHLFLGITLIALNQSDIAKHALRQALDLDAEGAVTAHIYLADVYSRNRQYREAADELRIYLKARPAAPNAARLRALEADLRARSAAQAKQRD